jgi:NADH dehydrogenase
MAMAEPLVTPRTAEEEEKLLGQRYGVKPTPGCQLQPPDIHGWTPTPPEAEAAKPVPSVAVVFGGSGMLGKSLLKKIAPKFEKVRVVSRNPEKAQAALSSIGGNIECVAGSVEDYGTVEAAVEGAGTVINLVGILFETSESRMHEVHYEGAKNVAQAAGVAGVDKLLHMSALGAVDESLSKYAQTKGWGESSVIAKFPNASVFRPSVVFGPDDNFFNQFANFPLPFIPLVGGGHTKFQPVYVEDVTEAMAKCATSDAGKGKVFEIGGPDVYTFRELMGKVKEFTGKSKPMQPIPFIVAEIQGWFMELMPTPMVTLDQVRQLKKDNVVSEGAATLKDLGIVPQSVDAIVPTYIK